MLPTISTFRKSTLVSFLALQMPMLIHAQSQPSADAIAWIRFIGAELRQLRLELLEQQIINESDRIRVLEKELGKLRLGRTQQKADENLINQQIAQLEQQAQDANTDTQSRAESLAFKNELLTAKSERMQAANARTAQETDIAARITASKARFQMLADRLRKSSPATP